MIPVIGVASGLGGVDEGSREGPLLLQQHFSVSVQWEKMFQSLPSPLAKERQIASLNQALAEEVCHVMEHSPFLFVIGGDHSCAIGTWSGVAERLRRRGKELALLWMDAHMDVHTPATTPSGNIHGMPLATLLGYGAPHLTHLLSPLAKVKPENVFLIGTRSYEQEEKALLEKLKVRIYYMEEVQRRGLSTIFSEILTQLAARKLAYGVSLDIDFFDAKEMSATATPEENGLHPEAFIKSTSLFAPYPPVVFEYVEFNPSRDHQNQSLKWSLRILENVLRHSVQRLAF